MRILLICSTKVSTCTAESDIQLHFDWLQVQRSTCHTLLGLHLQYKYIVSGSSKYKNNRVYFGRICTKTRMSSRPADLNKSTV